MKLVFIYGYPGTGKLTIANELAKITDFKIFHNHMTVDLVESIFGFGTKPFKELREKIWLEVFESASKYGISGLIFTFVFEKTISKDFIRNVENALGGKGTIDFIELHCNIDELWKRIENNSRKKYKKISSSDELKRLIRDKSLYSPKLNRPVLRIDNTKLCPSKVAHMIKEHYKL